MNPMAAKRFLPAILAAASLLTSGCAWSARYGTHRLRSEWSLVGICGPYSRTWFEDGNGKAVLEDVTQSSVSPDRQWLVLFDYGTSDAYVLDVRRDELRTVPIHAYPWQETVRWSPDGSALALMAGENPTRLAVVRMGDPPSLEWKDENPAPASDLEIDWRNGVPLFRSRYP